MRCRDDTVRRGDWKPDSSPTKWFLWTTKVIFSQTNVNCCPGDCKLIKHKLILFGWFIYFFSLKAKSRQWLYNNNNIYIVWHETKAIVNNSSRPDGFSKGSMSIGIERSTNNCRYSNDCIKCLTFHIAIETLISYPEIIWCFVLISINYKKTNTNKLNTIGKHILQHFQF